MHNPLYGSNMYCRCGLLDIQIHLEAQSSDIKIYLNAVFRYTAWVGISFSQPSQEASAMIRLVAVRCATEDRASIPMYAFSTALMLMTLVIATTTGNANQRSH